MPSVVIVGTGQAGFQAASSLRQAGHEGEVTLVGEEPGLPYQRPPLSKTFLKGDGDEGEVHLRPETFFASKEIGLVAGDRAVVVDRETQRVELASGRELHYDALVLATGSRPRLLPVPGADLDGVLVLRTVADAQRLRARLEDGPRVVIVGGGFIGLELAASAREKGAQVTVVEALDRTMSRVVTPEMSEHFAALHTEQGATLAHGATVAAITGDGAASGVELGDGTLLEADFVVVAIGIAPNVELAEEGGLAIDNGIVVDETLRTADPAIWAIGDCASYPSAHAGRRVRLESVQNATDQGRAVASSIMGQATPYAALPWFWSDQHTRKLQIAGLLDGYDTAVVRGDPAGEAFSVFCFAGDRLVCVESVNRMPDHMIARKLLAAGRSIDPDAAADESFDLKAYASAENA
jgi:3-phenylpropionate/trans-cinnamate dioxygenase ferredoxin reductase component